MNDKFVSVIIPVYNAEAYITECLDSILASDMDGIEIIAVNDGSTDSSLRLLKSYQEKYGIVVISQENGGASKARNAGLDIATGVYIGFVDADDWVEPNMYSRMYNVAVQEDADIVFCNIFRDGNEKMKKYMSSGTYRGESIAREIYPLLISNVNERDGKTTLRGATWPRLFRKSLIGENLIRYHEELVYNEDALFCIQATLAAKCYVYLGDDYLYHNRCVPDSLTKRYISNLWDRQKGLIDVLKESTKNQDFDFQPQIAKKTVDIAIYCIENECKSTNTASRQDSVKEIGKIIRTQEIRTAVAKINPAHLKNINRYYWFACMIGSSHLARLIAEKRMRRNRRK